MSQVNFTLEDIKQLLDDRLDERFTAEREHTRAMIQEGVKEGTDYVIEQFNSFIKDNFEPTMKKFDQHFDRIEDHLDHLDIDVATLRTDVRHIKQVLQIDRTSLSAPLMGTP
ncbi:MAG TPA: hypothetical protein VMT30_06055 [Candidatus Saccharimonadia bacterium]|nr:hypothetical protein [Candidatus Saccharimonadia bacterium]